MCLNINHPVECRLQCRLLKVIKSAKWAALNIVEDKQVMTYDCIGSVHSVFLFFCYSFSFVIIFFYSNE